MIEMLALAVAQMQPVRLLPIPQPPSVETVQPEVRLALPDLAIGGLRMIDDVAAEVEVRNNGNSATSGPVRALACVSLGRKFNGAYDAHYCAAPESVGKIAPGTSKWVRFDCFLDKGRISSTGGGLPGSGPGVEVLPPACVPLGLSGQPIGEVYAYADPMPKSSAADGPITAARRIQPQCEMDFGCVRETNEKNNARTFEAPFPQ